MLFTAMLPAVIIPVIGLGIDATMCYIVQAKLAAAVDGAALGSGRLVGTAADIQEIAAEFIKANFRASVTRGDGAPGFWRAYNLQTTVVYTGGAVKTVDIKAKADVPLMFARVFGQSFATVGAEATATRRDARLVFVLDRSGSMYDSGAYIPAKANAVSFTHLFTPNVDELGFVAFDGTAAVGYPAVGYPPPPPLPQLFVPPTSLANWDYKITALSVGGPDKNFLDGTANDMEHKINSTVTITQASTGTAEALWLAYAELQKAHLKAIAASATGVDEKSNAIVLLTDGVPQAVSIWPNNPNDNAVGVLKTDLQTATPCANRITAANTNPPPILGWISVARPFSSSYPKGLYRLGSQDPSNNQSGWLTYGGTGTLPTEQGTAASRAPSPDNTAGCSGLTPPPTRAQTGNLNSAANTDFNRIPSKDMYGNDMTGTAYPTNYKTGSRFVDADGNPVTNMMCTPAATCAGASLTRANVTAGFDWELAIWSAADSAAKRIRTDANKPNRIGDLSDMKIAIYVIGYHGSADIDQGLLMRIANVPGSTSYVGPPNEQTGFYVLASDTESMAVAFQKVASAILRLSK
ncbi:MAG: hypothetical protein LAP87_21920 [Acidobacteriia bacterium]|nr:hypothetical protein [Terriglobia bacterium]